MKKNDIWFAVGVIGMLVLSIAGLVVMYLHMVPVLINP
jgi:hypothetical protein